MHDLPPSQQVQAERRYTYEEFRREFSPSAPVVGSREPSDPKSAGEKIADDLISRLQSNR